MITIKWMHARYDAHRIELDESELNPVTAAAIEAFKAGDRAPLDTLIDEWQSDDTFVKTTETPRAGVGVYGRTGAPIQEVSVEE